MTRRMILDPQQLPEPGGRRLLHLGDRCLVVFDIDGARLAIDDSCPHQGASLFSGRRDGYFLQCPAHGLRFDLAKGCLAGNPALPLAVYPIHIDEGGVYLDLPD